MSVVVVEDDDAMREAIGRMLGAAGLRPTVYSNAERALEGTEAGLAACLVIDIQLPGMTGFDLHDRLRATGQTAPVIFITGVDDIAPRQRALACAGASYLVKPFLGTALIAEIRAVVERAAASPPTH